MFGVPLDAWYVWIGLAIISSAAFGVVTTLPSAAPPDAAGAARTVDSVAASAYAATGSHPLPNAESVRIGTDSISVRGAGGTDHAAFGYGPVVPTIEGSKLHMVLLGEPPSRMFVSPSRFERAIWHARRAEPEWRGSERLTVRRVQWEGIDAVLVG